MTIYNPHIGIERNEFIEQNIKLIHKVCQSFKNIIHLEYDELVSIGCMGMMKAYEKYDPTKIKKEDDGKIKFSTYAFPIIKGELLRYIRDDNPSAKFSRTIKENYNKIRRAGLEDEEIEVISRKLEMHCKDVKNALEYNRNRFAKSVNQTIFEGDNEPITILDQLGVHDDFSGIFVDDFLNYLNEKEKTVIGFIMAEKTQREIGKVIGVSQVQVSRLLKKIGEKYEAYSKEDNINEKPMRYNSLREEKKMTKKREKQAGNMEEAKRLLAETNLSYKQIADITGCNQGTIGVYGPKYRSKEVREANMQKLKKNKEESVKQKNNEVTPEMAKALVQAEQEIHTKNNKEVAANSTTTEEKVPGVESKKSKILTKVTYQISGEDATREETVEALEKIITIMKSNDVKDVNFNVSIEA